MLKSINTLKLVSDHSATPFQVVLDRGNDILRNVDLATVRLALPKGRMQDGVLTLLEDAGMSVSLADRVYRPTIAVARFETKILKPQNIVEMLQHGSRDIGFIGADWVAELDGNLVELLDTGLDPVRIVVASPASVAETLLTSKQHFIIASEYVRLAEEWILSKDLNAKCIRSYGATEVFPPEDADCIIDNTASGSTLNQNGLTIIAEIMQSSTRLYANPRALEDRTKRSQIESFTMLLKSVLEARNRTMLEVNVTNDCLDTIVNLLPSMRRPTISVLHGESGYAVKAAVRRADLPKLIPALKRAGGTDIAITSISQIIA